MENAIVEALPDVDPSLIVTPIHQKRLVGTGGGIRTVDTQANELIATSNWQWGLATYNMDGGNDETYEDVESVSEMTEISGESASPNDIESPRWYRIPLPDRQYTSRVRFIAKDVIASFEYETIGLITTWCARSSLHIGSLKVRGTSFFLGLCKLSETEFVVGGSDGHLDYISHRHGCELKEMKRIWKAHQYWINAIVFRNGIFVSTSDDWTAKVWDSKNKTLLSILHHNGPVQNATISDRYILTHEENAQIIRIFANCEAFPLVKMFRTGLIESPKFLDSGLLTYWSLVGINQYGMVFFEIESECILGQLKVSPVDVCDHAFLADGRVVAVGTGGCRGIIADLPEYLRTLVVPESPGKTKRARRRRFCTLM